MGSSIVPRSVAMSIVALIDVDQNGPQCPRHRGRGKPGPPLVGGVRSPLLGAACI